MFQKLKNVYHLFQALIANSIYGFPSKKLYVIGVTGTDGKTTTASLIYHILKESGKKVSMISTVAAYIGGKEFDTGFHVTTPSPFHLQKYIKKVIDAGDEYLVLETTSHALDQNRVWGIQYEIGVLTNISHEHLDYHKSFGEYIKSKEKLFERSFVCVLNKDDSSYETILNRVTDKKIITYSLADKHADFTTQNFPFKTNMVGEFNKQNCLAAVAACSTIGVSDGEIRKALLSFTLPIGRQQIVYPSTRFDSARRAGSGQVPFKVMIDFAHTPGAFEKILPAVKDLTKGRLIHVFGAAGKRDSTKRPLMGKVSAQFADIIVLTSEDPRGEEPDKISDEILSGISNFEFQISNVKETQNWEEIRNQKLDIRKDEKYVFKIPNRKEAIEFAVQIAQKGDLVLCTGKGHEQSMNYDGVHEENWDEEKTVAEAISLHKV